MQRQTGLATRTARLFRALEGLYRYGVLTGYTVIALFPLYWIVSTSLKPPVALISPVPEWLFAPTLVNYRGIFERGFERYLLNSAVLSGVAVAVAIVIGSLSGYALSRFPLRHKERFFLFALTTRMAPPVAIAVPLYLLLTRLRLVDTYQGMVLVYVFLTLGFAIWMTRTFFDEVDREVEEAALLDGLSHLGSLFRVAIPIAAPGLMATATLMFIFTWNEFFFASVLTRFETTTFTVHLTAYFGAQRILWGELTAASTLGSLIPVAFALVVRRYLIRGMTLGMVIERERG